METYKYGPYTWPTIVSFSLFVLVILPAWIIYYCWGDPALVGGLILATPVAIWVYIWTVRIMLYAVTGNKRYYNPYGPTGK